MNTSQITQAQNHINLFKKIVDPFFIPIFEECSKNSNHSIEVLYSAYQCASYVCKAGISGYLIEFGVLNGGTLGCIASAVKNANSERNVIGVDTFSGYPVPNLNEYDIHGNQMLSRYKDFVNKGITWGGVNYDNVSRFINKIYPKTKLIKLEVNSGFNYSMIGLSDLDQVAYLRLDMNWYEPTLEVLKCLWDKIPVGGILSVVSGHHSGASQAVKEFFENNPKKQNFIHVNYSTIVCTKI